MTDSDGIQELLDKEPFEPFRIRMTDGNSYDVVNRALVVPMDTKLFIALPKDRWKFLSFVDIASVEDGISPRRRSR